VYKAKDLKQTGKIYAVKLEPKTTDYPSLRFEAGVYKTLKSSLKSQFVIKPVWNGPVKNDKGLVLYHAMVMPLLGPSLQSLWNQHRCYFRWCTIISLAEQMVSTQSGPDCWSLIILRCSCPQLSGCTSRGSCKHPDGTWAEAHVHTRHRDIKPDNFVVGLGKNACKIYLIDFGLAKVYAKDDGHIPFRCNRSFVGNFRFAGVGTTSGIGGFSNMAKLGCSRSARTRKTGRSRGHRVCVDVPLRRRPPMAAV
jgi:casein kinase I homolog HRR25